MERLPVPWGFPKELLPYISLAQVRGAVIHTFRRKFTLSPQAVRNGNKMMNPLDQGKSQYKDYRNGSGKVLHTLKTIDFIGRLIRHIPPHYFNVIRHFGILASRVKKKNINPNASRSAMFFIG
uniref:Transposase n=2 Tax=Candidatus Kentrum sp. SD TaxID=2126332 RepID=A0A450YE56_9GAMM|nr:MAG: Putative transposase [Candidatus Kentron sp. SD]